MNEPMIVAGQFLTTDGTKVEVAGGLNRTPAFDPRTGEHLWTVYGMWRVNPVEWIDPNTRTDLDHENLLTVQGPACYYCERVYEPRLLRRRCPGKPVHHV